MVPLFDDYPLSGCGTGAFDPLEGIVFITLSLKKIFAPNWYLLGFVKLRTLHLVMVIVRVRVDSLLP